MFILIYYLTSLKSPDRAGHCEEQRLCVHSILCGGAKPLKMELLLFIQIENLFSFQIQDVKSKLCFACQLGLESLLVLWL